MVVLNGAECCQCLVEMVNSFRNTLCRNREINCCHSRLTADTNAAFATSRGRIGLKCMLLEYFPHFIAQTLMNGAAPTPSPFTGLVFAGLHNIHFYKHSKVSTVKTLFYLMLTFTAPEIPWKCAGSKNITLLSRGKKREQLKIGSGSCKGQVRVK